MKTLEESQPDENKIISRPDSPNSVLNEDSCRVNNTYPSLNASIPGRKIKITRNSQVKITRNQRHSIATHKVVEEKKNTSSKNNPFFNGRTRSSICTSTPTGNLASSSSSSSSSSFPYSSSSSTSTNLVKQKNNLTVAVSSPLSSRSVPTTCFYK